MSAGGLARGLCGALLLVGGVLGCGGNSQQTASDAPPGGSCDGVPTSPTVLVPGGVIYNGYLQTNDAIYFTGDGVTLSRITVGGSPSVVAMGLPQGHPAGFDDTAVYWVADLGTGSSEIVKVPLAGGSTVILATALVPYQLEIAVANRRVYWFEQNQGLVSIADGEAAPRPETAQFGEQPNADINGSHVYWLGGGNPRTIQRIPTTGGGAMDVVADPRDANGENARGRVVADDQRVYWATPSSVNECAFGCSARTPLVDSTTNAVDPDLAYNGVSFAYVKLDAAGDEHLMRLSRGGLPTEIATASMINGVQYRGCTLTWLAYDGAAVTNLVVVAAP